MYNLQGDVIALIDASGNIVVEYKYDAWGKIIGRTGGLASTLGYLNPFRYRGYVYDEETGLYYLRSRYYKPEWGRFINADAMLGKRGALLSHNLFAYCLNSPIAYADLNGFMAVECEHAFFKNTYYMSDDAFYSYLLWQYERHPNQAPNPPIVDAMKELYSIVADKVIDDLNNWFTKSKKATDYALPIIGPFFNINYAWEEYIVDEMSRNSSAPGGYKAVKVELLYGSHSAEVQLTFLDQNNNIVKGSAIQTQGYSVILDMMESMELLVDNYGGLYYYEGVTWKYSLAQ